jgi:hypothetical protein
MDAPTYPPQAAYEARAEGLTSASTTLRLA